MSRPAGLLAESRNRSRERDVQRRVRSAALFAIALTLIGSACNTPAAPQPTGTLEVLARAGPVCPVETIPPDPDCAPRPVAGAQVIVSPADGRDIVVANGTTDADGVLELSLAPGDYVVAAGEVKGLFGHPEGVRTTVVAGQTTSVTLDYDTGIR